ncbi:MAG: hypothetical protein ACM3JD_13615 [Rudaea sp.]
MKTGTLLVGAALLFALLLSSAAPVQAAGYDIRFNGYCDGIHLQIPSLGIGKRYTVDGYQTGCMAGALFGVAKPNLVGQFGVGKGTEYLTLTGYPALFVIKSNHTWAAYNLSAGVMQLINSGTWSRGLPLGPGAVPAGNTYNPNAVAPPEDGDQRLGIQATKDIAFDGYCDGAHLVSPSIGLGKFGTVDGHSTGCLIAGFIGFKTKIRGMAGTYVITHNNYGYWGQILIYPNKTWQILAVSLTTNRIFLVNHGTWHLGTPTAPSSNSAPASGTQNH